MNIRIVLLGNRKVGKRSWLKNFKFGHNLSNPLNDAFDSVPPTRLLNQSTEEEICTTISTLWNVFGVYELSFVNVQNDTSKKNDNIQESFFKNAEIVIFFYDTTDKKSLEIFDLFVNQIKIYNKQCEIKKLVLKIREIIIIGTKADQNSVVIESDINLKKEMIEEITDIKPNHFRMSALKPDSKIDDCSSFAQFNLFLKAQIEKIIKKRKDDQEEHEEKKIRLESVDESKQNQFSITYASSISTISEEEYIESFQKSGTYSTHDESQSKINEHHTKLSMMTTIEEKQSESVCSRNTNDKNTHSIDIIEQTNNILTKDAISQARTQSQEITDEEIKQNANFNLKNNNQLLPTDAQKQRSCSYYCCHYCCEGLLWIVLSGSICAILGIIAGSFDKHNIIKGFHIPKHLFQISFANWSPLWLGALIGFISGIITGGSIFTIYLLCKCLCGKEHENANELDVVENEKNNNLTIPVTPTKFISL